MDLTDFKKQASWTAEMDLIYEQYGEELFRICYFYLGNWHLAEDAFQEAMVRIWMGLDGFRAESSFRTWAVHITTNVCRAFLRSKAFQQWKKELPIEAAEAQGWYDATEEAELVDALAKLPKRYREVMILRFLEEMSLQEIGNILGLSVFTVSSRLRKAKQLLRGKLKL